MKSLVPKLGAIALATLFVFCLAGCGGQAKQETLYKVGDTVETDVVSLTLDKSALAISLVSSMPIGTAFSLDNDYYTAKEYVEGDSLAAGKGKTFVTFSITVKNLDRASVDFGRSSEGFVSVEYDGKTYSSKDSNCKLNYGYSATGDGHWRTASEVASNILLLAGTEEMRRGYLEIPVEVSDLSSPYKITFELPTSDGKTQPFTFDVQ